MRAIAGKVVYKTNAKLAAKALKYKDNQPIHHGWLCKAIWDTCEDLYDGMNRIILDGFTISGFIMVCVGVRPGVRVGELVGARNSHPTLTIIPAPSPALGDRVWP